MKITEQVIKDNIYDLFITTLLYFPCLWRVTIPKVICRAFDIQEEHVVMTVQALSIWSEKEFKELGYVGVKLIDGLHHVFITEEGKAYAKTIDNPLCIMIEREANEDKTVH